MDIDTSALSAERPADGTDDLNESLSDGDSQQQQPLIEPNIIQDYIRRQLPFQFQDMVGNAEPLPSNCFADPSSQQALRRFITDPQSTALYIYRRSTYIAEQNFRTGSSPPVRKFEADSPPTSGESAGKLPTLQLSTDGRLGEKNVNVYCCIKLVSQFDPSKPLGHQLLLLNFSGESPFGLIHAYISRGCAPLFKYQLKNAKTQDRDDDRLAQDVEKKFAELETGLLQMQQNIGVPEVHLHIHPFVQSVIDRARAENRKPTPQDYDAATSDSALLGQLQAGVAKWVQEIKKITTLERDAASGSAVQEVSFWNNLQKALNDITDKRSSAEVQLTLDILKQGRRYAVTLSLDSDTGLQEALGRANDYCQLMRDLPLQELLSATTLPKLREAVVSIFSHLRKIRNTKYPIPRLLSLVQAISRDFQNQMLKAIETRNLVQLPYDDCVRLLKACIDIFQCWQEELERLHGILRDIAKKGGRGQDGGISRTTGGNVWRVIMPHKPLQDRCEALKKFREQHHQLQEVITRVLGHSASHGGGGQTPAITPAGGGETATTPMMSKSLLAAEMVALDEVNAAYDCMKQIDCLDTSPEGQLMWQAALRRYDDKIDLVETRIIDRLREQLAAAKNAAEMFRIFGQYNALFVRPKVRGAIREYQTQLMQRVREDVDLLMNMHKSGYPQSAAAVMLQSMHVPPTAGFVYWCRLLERQLIDMMKRIESVLGKDWENHVEGKKLKSELDNFCLVIKHRIGEAFDDWLKKAQQKEISEGNRLLAVGRVRTQAGTQLKLRVNFNFDMVALSKEVRVFKAGGQTRVPLPIVNKSHMANNYYPSAISLRESLTAYQRANEFIASDPDYGSLVLGLRREVRECLKEGCSLSWESYKIEGFVQRFYSVVNRYEQKVEELMEITTQVSNGLEALDSCPYTSQAFHDALNIVQRALDDLEMKQYTSIDAYVRKITLMVEDKLVERAGTAVSVWRRTLVRSIRPKAANALQAAAIHEDDTDESPVSAPPTTGKGGTVSIVDAVKAAAVPKLLPITHEFRIVAQVMHLHPPVNNARTELLRQLYLWANIVLGQKRLRLGSSSSRIDHQIMPPTTLQYDPSSADAVAGGDNTFHNLTKRLDSNVALRQTLSTINLLMADVEAYVAQWYHFQALWDLDEEQLTRKLGNDLSRWMTLLKDLKAARQMFDTSETRLEFGPIIIDYAKVQQKVTMRYDVWHREVLNKFGKLLADSMQRFYDTISKARAELEQQQSLDTGGTADSVAFITRVQELRRKHAMWEENVKIYQTGQQTLERQRFQFPNQWLYAENVAGEWEAFSEMLRRKDASIQSRLASLQQKINQESEAVEQRTEQLTADWDAGKPVSGDLDPQRALEQLGQFEARMTRLRDDRIMLKNAKEALEFQPTGIPPSVADQKLGAYLEEVQDMKNAWLQVKVVWDGVQQLREQQWLTVQPRKVRQSLDTLMAQLREMPANLRNYSSFEFAKTRLQLYIKTNALITELKSEALKERHWNQVVRQLNVTHWNLKDLTLGQIWDADLLRHERVVRDVLIQAQGELALENFLSALKQTWTLYDLELTNYQNKTHACKLIRGWDDLFNKLKENINSLNAMKLSPYYKVFEEETLLWEDKLNKINAAFDAWIDVQRRWVYLDGIFSGSSDIQALLPVETQRFESITHEFIALMRRVAKSPKVLDVMTIDRLPATLERIGGLLSKIQKGLSEYLERQRSSFPRFYFVGDEDLLEIIGNSKSIGRIQKHFRKMFAGVAALLLSEDETLVIGVASREGERVMLLQPVNLQQTPSINEWLALVDKSIRYTLTSILEQALTELSQIMTTPTTTSSNDAAPPVSPQKFLAWIDKFPAQIVILCAQIKWTEAAEQAIVKLESTGSAKFDEAPLLAVEKHTHGVLNVLADSVLSEQPPIMRQKLENLITEYVHKRDVTRSLIAKRVASRQSFAWLCNMRLYFNPANAAGANGDPTRRLLVCIANAEFFYGFEYYGVTDKLVQTPLTDRCFLTMTQALHNRLGGSPFGPAGTGKTESVKALGTALGKFVIVFNCDEKFDFQAMGRIFVGLCQVGAWGCFDEFNRLDERILSAVSQQIQNIQEALRAYGRGNAALSAADSKKVEIELVNRQVRVQPDMAIFITMNPDYAGRSNLPENLKKLFMSLAMTQPDRQLIAEVMLFSQGFRSAELLARKIVPFFRLCAEQLSRQPHYDFGLRALKYVLVSAGGIKRRRLLLQNKSSKISSSMNNSNNDGDATPKNEAADLSMLSSSSQPQPMSEAFEQEILIQAVSETLVPKLVTEDVPLMQSLLNDVFPNVAYSPEQVEELATCIARVCQREHLLYGGEDDRLGEKWLAKVFQLYQILAINHGIMLVGPSGTGKSSAWRTLLKALQYLDGMEGVAHVINPKAMSKEKLYGSLDPNTREWTDGLFTHILRKIIDNLRGELQTRQWIIFDGDVDPEWVENLNSVLDDNRLLTLPNGERLALPPNVRILFEVQDLEFATPATVSRCGMIWFNDDLVESQMLFSQFLLRLRSVVCRSADEADDEMINFTFTSPPPQKLTSSPSIVEYEVVNSGGEPTTPGGAVMSPNTAGAGAAVNPELMVQQEIARIVSRFFRPRDLVENCLRRASSLPHIMDFTQLRALSSLFSLLNIGVRKVHAYNGQHPDFPMPVDQLEKFMVKTLAVSLVWSLAGDSRLGERKQLSDYICSSVELELPGGGGESSLIDYEPTIRGGWEAWQTRVPEIEIETHRVAATDLVVPTLDTVRHRDLLYTWLKDHRPLILCGPPGSGKTMTLFDALRSLSNMEVVGLNFSSATSPELLLKTFDHYCEYRKTPNGVTLTPIQPGKWLILFCDEINLPDNDKYGTQRVIAFIRQLVELGGFYRTSDHAWVTIERMQFVGACNPPTDPGRKPLSHRFLRHVPVVYVDYPAELSLKQIYGTFNRSMLKLTPSLRGYADALTNAMVRVYLASQERFTQDQQPHYIYSPRELTRWVRGMHEAMGPLDEELSVNGLVRLWAHEGLRLFQDRLVDEEQRRWTDELLNDVALSSFPGVLNPEVALKRPILYSNWTSKNYVPVDREQLRAFTQARLKVFYEEEFDVQLVLFDEVLDHVLRIDRIFRQTQGHVLLIGVSGSGKTTLSRFVAWMNGLSVFQIKVHSRYTADDFDEDLRHVLRRAGCKAEKLCFILDESNMLESSFLERMNTLLANGEVPGLFEGDEFNALMTQCKEGATRSGVMIDSHEELYKWFTQQVCRNLHVVFTMNPSTEGLKDRAATSPALFNRCVVNWFGDWPDTALFHVGQELTKALDIDSDGSAAAGGKTYRAPDFFPVACALTPTEPTYRQAVVNAFVFVHLTLKRAYARMVKRGHRVPVVTPRHFLDFIQHYVKLFREKREELEEQQLHINVGLRKIQETVEQVEELQKSLAVKRTELKGKEEQAQSKLQEMLQDQGEAERQKATLERMQTALKAQQVAIAEKQTSVRNELADVEPAVVEAREAVQSIKKQHLVEVRSMANPPALVKIALESICVMLGEQNATDWKSIRAVTMRDNFITTLLNFQTEKISDETRQIIRQRYFSNPDFNFEKVNRASQACGPMVKWCIAQVSYADMLHSIGPLRGELARLESEAHASQVKAEETNQHVMRLEAKIGDLKEEYAVIVAEAQRIKADLASVEAKVDRSVSLLRSLSSEQTRWQGSRQAFSVQMGTLVGDVLMSSAFIAYAGYFDQHMRQSLFSSWSQHLQQAAIEFRPDIARVEYLSTPDERIEWLQNQLPADDLCIENAIMLRRYNRYPLVIDPSGQATEFLTQQLQARKVTKTSFLDSAFRKTLESALRFGSPLIVQDVENYDPIVNPVLNKEVRRTGGRALITIGDQDIDLSPAFSIFLTTRDPTAEFAPDLSSRVTFVNFTVTRNSLQRQCLDRVLKAERPDIDRKRSDLLKLQGEFKLRLRHLEQQLLAALNDAKGRILDDDKLLASLESLKREAAEVMKKADETDTVMREVEEASDEYRGLAGACSNIFFTMEQLSLVNVLYQYSLQFFLDIFHSVLHSNPNLKNVTDFGKRLQIISYDLLHAVYERVSRGMLYQDRLVFAMLLTRIWSRLSANARTARGGAGGSSIQPQQSAAMLSREDDAFDFLLTGQEAAAAVDNTTSLPAETAVHDRNDLLSREQRARLMRLQQKLEVFRNAPAQIARQADEVRAWLASRQPELRSLQLWTAPSGVDPSEVEKELYDILTVQALRPDRLRAVMKRYVTRVLDANFLDVDDQVVDVGRMVDAELTAKTPLMLCSVPGHDASWVVEDLCAARNVSIHTVPLGSAEGFEQADRFINSGHKSGRWVLLKNCHLAPAWLVQLEKRLHSMQPNAAFRLFIAMEINPKMSVNLLRMSRVLTFEPSTGISSNVSRTLFTIEPQRMARLPVERSRLYFLLAWFHGIVQERLRYCPLGWSKHYEFTESEMRIGLDMIDAWLDTRALGRTNISAEKLPWDAFQQLLLQCIYGGKVDNEFDYRLLGEFVTKLFQARCFLSQVPLASIDRDVARNKSGESADEAVDGITELYLPEGAHRDVFTQWIDTQLARVQQSPAWLGLPDNAETVLLSVQGKQTLTKLLLLQQVEDDDEAGVDETESAVTANKQQRKSSQAAASGDEAVARPAWMEHLLGQLLKWSTELPTQYAQLQRTADVIKDPLLRFFEREVKLGHRLYKTVVEDLNDLIAICRGEMKQTNHHRELVDDILRGRIPPTWKRYYQVPPNVTVLQWFADFIRRVDQLQRICATAAQRLKQFHAWLGGFFMPEAYITATRQYVAQANAWPLEDLQLDTTVYQNDPTVAAKDSAGLMFVVTGMVMQGAKCDAKQLSLSDAIYSDMPYTAFVWKNASITNGNNTASTVTLPVYLNTSRTAPLFTMAFERRSDETTDAATFYERGVAIICSAAFV